MSMQGFSAAQINHAGAITLDHHIRGPLFQSGIQKKPLVAKIESKAKTFPGGNELITIGVQFDTGAGGVNDGLRGFSHTDTVGFYDPSNGKRASYTWREHHLGITLTETQLKSQGVMVLDDNQAPKTMTKAGAHKLADLMETAMADFGEQYAKSLNGLLWGDGTADAAALHGLRSMILDIPTIGIVGGLSNLSYPKWRNRARTAAFLAHPSFNAAQGGGAITSATADGGALLQILQEEMRHLRRYGGTPDCFFCGSDFLKAMEKEMRANGNYSETGFTQKQDGSMGEMYFKGVPVVQDYTLDDLGRSKFAYIWDSSDISLMLLEGDWKRQRTPQRVFDAFVFHQSLVCTGQMTARRRNSAGVYEIV